MDGARGSVEDGRHGAEVFLDYAVVKLDKVIPSPYPPQWSELNRGF